MAQSTYILTAELDGDSFAWLDGLRRQHFPPDRNVLSAHLTMFHRLSRAQVDTLTRIWLPSAPIEIYFEIPLFPGSSVAIKVRSTELETLRDRVNHGIAGDLSRQDAQGWKPHVTVQNKVPADVARTLSHQLTPRFVERTGHATGLQVWEYLGGPWKLAHRMSFGGD